MFLPARLFPCSAIALAMVALAPPAWAQGGAAASREVVQPLPPRGAEELNQALRTLSRDPQNLEALLTAGRMSLRLGDLDAAAGFFRRAENLGSAGGRAKAGLAAAEVRRRQPIEALRLFAEAEAKGADLGEYAGDAGLAYDLVGDNARAQTYYHAALAKGEDEEVTRRLALSLAISGDQFASETTLLPLLQHQDLAAYRTRAFALAVLGKTDEAVAIAEAVMPATLSSRISPYLRYMPRLTRAQQAAAANFGHFPQASEIGRDDPRIAEYSGRSVPAAIPVSTTSDSRLAPAGEPLGPRDARPAAAPMDPSESPGLLSSAGPSQAFDLARAPDPAPAGVVERAAAEVSAAMQAPGAPATPPAAPPKPEFASLSDAFAGFESPGAVAPAPGAVDITKITPRREVEKKPEQPKPAKPADPSRIWVQVATGKDRGALGYDWRRMTGKSAALFRSRQAYVAKWGQTNRLLTGPFSSQADANAFVRELKKAGIDSFTFTSEQGEKVEALPRR